MSGTTGKTYGLQDGSVYLKKWNTFDPFIWGGRCMRLEETSSDEGSMTVTTRQNPRGGVERDAIRQDVPGASTASLVMKRMQADRARTELRTCFWEFDKRYSCDGSNRDSPFSWEQIDRLLMARTTSRTSTGTTWEGDDDSMVTFEVSALEEVDIYRVTAEESAWT